jgi:hypothetical protein
LADDTVLHIIAICVAIFGFLLVLLAVGQFYGGTWASVTSEVAKFILLITVFGLGCYALFSLVGRR